ncbi:O-antigen ligase family protein [Hymenobacter daeguensis]
MKTAPPLSEALLNSRWLLPLLLLGALAAGWLASLVGPVLPGLLVVVPALLLFVVLVFRSPHAGFVVFVSYCFVINFLSRHSTVPVGLAMEGILVSTWLAVLFYHREPPQWRRVRNDLCLLTFAWFVINILELLNPAGVSVAGWFNECRTSTFLWLLTVPLAFLVFNRRGDLNLFLYLVIGFSLVGTLYGIKQKFIGVDAMEQAWLDEGPGTTHIIWGVLRVFSTYSDAAQFGSSQAHICLICLILALGPFSWPKKLLLAAAAGLLLYGMLISGTRGALFVLAVGVFIYLALSKQLKVLLLGCVVAAGVFFIMKYTHIGDSNQSVYRMRSALDPNDPSFQFRLNNQKTMREYLATRPFGGGVGVMGAWGKTYNKDKFLSHIPPDSYFVKIWGQYGIVGFLIWFGIMLYILGKCAGIVWNTRDPRLRQKLLALTAGYGGILMCSYGNEIMNQMPSSMLLYVSWVLVFLGPSFDTPSLKAAAHA